MRNSTIKSTEKLHFYMEVFHRYFSKIVGNIKIVSSPNISQRFTYFRFKQTIFILFLWWKSFRTSVANDWKKIGMVEQLFKRKLKLINLLKGMLFLILFCSLFQLWNFQYYFIGNMAVTPKIFKSNCTLILFIRSTKVTCSFSKRAFSTSCTLSRTRTMAWYSFSSNTTLKNER